MCISHIYLFLCELFAYISTNLITEVIIFFNWFEKALYILRLLSFFLCNNGQLPCGHILPSVLLLLVDANSDDLLPSWKSPLPWPLWDFPLSSTVKLNTFHWRTLKTAKWAFLFLLPKSKEVRGVAECRACACTQNVIFHISLHNHLLSCLLFGEKPKMIKPH